MILAYEEIMNLVVSGVVQGADPAHVNAASLDVRLGDGFLVEKGWPDEHGMTIIDLAKRESPVYQRRVIEEGGSLLLDPGEFVLAHTMEVFHLPDNISAHFMLKSSIARAGLNQLAAVWCDAGWNNSTLTLELANVTRYHHLKLTPGMLIGQMVFHQHIEVPAHASYRSRGRYNGDASVTSVKL